MLKKLNTCPGLVLLAVIVLVEDVSSSGFGKCPNYPSMPKYNITKFLGKWYEVERSFYLPEIASGCTTVTFDNTSARDFDGMQLEVAVKTMNLWTGSPSVQIGNAIPENEKSSIMNVQLQTRLPVAIARYLPGFGGKYQILYTDYENFAIFWSCSNFGIAHADQIWLLGRDQDFSLEVRQKIYNSMTLLGLDPDRLILSKNKNCPSTL